MRDLEKCVIALDPLIARAKPMKGLQEKELK